MALFRYLYADLFENPKTRDLSAPAVLIFLQCMFANQAGLLERSVSKMAKKAKCDEPEARDAIAQLVETGNCKWWPEHEALWLINAAERQCGKRQSNWERVAHIAMAAEPEIRAAIIARYADTFRTTSRHLKPGVIADAIPELGSLEGGKVGRMERENIGRVPCAAPGTAPGMVPEPADPLSLLIKWASEGGDPDGLGPWVDVTTPAGVTIRHPTVDPKLASIMGPGQRRPEDIHALVLTLGSMVEAGKLDPDRWNTAILCTTWFSKLESDAATWVAEQARKAEEEERTRPASAKDMEAFRASMREQYGDGDWF